MKLVVCLLVLALAASAFAGHHHQECSPCLEFVRQAETNAVAAVKDLPEECQRIAESLIDSGDDLDTVCSNGLAACLCSASQPTNSDDDNNDEDDDDEDSMFSHHMGIFMYVGIALVAFVSLLVACRICRCCARRCARRCQKQVVVPKQDYDFESAPQYDHEAIPLSMYSEQQMAVPVLAPVHVDGVACYYVPAEMTQPPEGWSFAAAPIDEQ